MNLRQRLDRDETLITAWSVTPFHEMAGLLAGCPFDAVTVDMQHAPHTESSAFESARAITSAGKPAILRIPVGRADLASKALDMGFEAVIAPMINTAAAARAFAAAMKYPPVGERSWGPIRALQLHKEHTAQSYFRQANQDTLAFAMIETKAAVAALDDILSVDGVDGVFVGPSDLSISWTDGKDVDPGRADMQDALADIARRTRDSGKFAAIFAVDPSLAPRFSSMGYRLIALNTDPGVVQAGAAVMLEQARG